MRGQFGSGLVPDGQASVVGVEFNSFGNCDSDAGGIASGGPCSCRCIQDVVGWSLPCFVTISCCTVRCGGYAWLGGRLGSVIDTPSFVVVSSTDEIELREYSAYIVAEVDVEASNLIEAAERGFRPLAGFIFGDNAPSDKIAMTTPVTAAPKAEKIKMTAPVTASPSDAGTYTVRFSMPPTWTMETLPEPTNADVRLLEVPAHRVLVMKFRGRNDPSRMMAATEQLARFADDNELGVDGEPFWAGYSAPYVPVPLRKWEMQLKLG